jgi:glycosyltransferase involved in cell wall biosynthesis
MRVLVVGNYRADRQQSMLRFSELLVRLYRPYVSVSFVSPPVVAARIPGLPSLVRKYLAYIDKLLIFPFFLALRARAFDRVHIADHGNSYYSFCCARRQSVVTCHDLLAIRGAYGDASSACQSSPIGIWLQKLIVAGLRRAAAVAFDSQATYDDFQRLIGAPDCQRHAVIPIPLNSPFSADPNAFPLTPRELAQIPLSPYLLMVGSAHPRKNRVLALQLLERLGLASPFRIVFAGDPLTQSEEFFRNSHPLGDRVFSIEGPSHALLNRLYCKAHALLFPSLSEGYGWPVLEAQTCRCPVIASQATSIPEVAGEGALYAAPTDVATFAEHVRKLVSPPERRRLIHLGIENTRRFHPDLLGEAYRSFAFQV